MEQGTAIPPSAPILLVEDDPTTSDVVRSYLERDGHSTAVCRSGGQALDILRQVTPRCVVLDVMLPERDGFEICAEIRRRGSRVPILILSARADELDRIRGLQLGADDYLVKPFSPRELVARVAALLRRAEAPSLPPPVVRLGNLELLPESRDIRVAGARVPLTRHGFSLLNALLEQPGRVYSRSQLLAHLHRGHGEPAAGERAVDVQVARLRRCLRGWGASVTVTTVRGLGYKLEELGA
ncbi:MAG: response regulator transcription factor [Candidatus Dormiibacterota bacterium]